MDGGREFRPEVLPLLPLLYIAWADGDLSPEELEALSAQLRSQGWLAPADRKWACGWLDPSRPPSPERLRGLLGEIRRLAASAPEAVSTSLAALGLHLAETTGGAVAELWRTPGAREALHELEASLGVIPGEACCGLLAPDPSAAGPAEVAAPRRPASFDVELLARILDGEQRDVRQRVRAILREPGFRHEYGLPTAVRRERVLARCRDLAARGLGALGMPVEYGGGGDPAGFIAVFETLAFGDLSLLVKFGVQFGLFGGSVAALGTHRHHERILPDAGTLALPGCFAMTELGHGSDVRRLQTVARYDPASEEFEIHTPCESARKEYIGNAAAHGRVATVFAHLETRGERFGVHAFLVPLRDAEGRVLPGVRIEDSGEKLGLNGVDNGRIWFDRVRVPRENLLDRFAGVEPDGGYTSPIPSESRRFFTMLGTLVGGRVSVALAASSAAKSGLAIAVRYGDRRRQFGPARGGETAILDYRAQQRRLMPRLATTFALDFALKELTRRYLARTERDQQEVEALAAGLKAYSTWHTVDTLQACRETCGGQGYLAVNRFAALKADTDVFTTFEGDNTVLMQFAGGGLLTGYRRQFAQMRLLGALKLLGGRAATAVTEMNPVVTRLSDEGHLRDPEFHLAALRYREEDLLGSAARRLKKRIDAGMDSFTALNECQDHVVKLATANAERVIYETFAAGVGDCADPAVGASLARLRDLFALERIEADRGWYLESGYVAPAKAKAIRKLVNRLCAEVREDAVPLVESFGIPGECLAAPIAFAPPDGRVSP